jgi:hypothetical protein
MRLYLLIDKPAAVPGHPGELQRLGVLVRRPGHLRAGLRQLRLVAQDDVPPPRRQVVAPGAPPASRRPTRRHAEAGRAPPRLRQPDPQGRHGNKQQRPGRDGRAGILPRLAAKGAPQCEHCHVPINAVLVHFNVLTRFVL